MNTVQSIESGRFNIGWGSWGTVDLHLTDTGEGIIDEPARRCFTQGQCHSMALALHAATGWPLFIWCWAEDFDMDEWTHATVRHPEGFYVDINGAWDEHEGTEEYGFPHEFDADIIDDLIRNDVAHPLDTPAAMHFVPTILKGIPS